MEFMIIATTHFLALISPGPDFFLIMQAALRLPLRFCFAICAGIASANGVYLILAVTGIEVIKKFTLLNLGLKYLGAIYLLAIGVMLLKTPKQDVTLTNNSSFLRAHHLGKQFSVGFMSGILNPKNMIFYLSLFTVMVSPQTPLFQRSLYALWMVGIVFIWDLFVVITIGNQKVRNKLGNGIFYIEKVAGSALASSGIIIIFS